MNREIEYPSYSNGPIANMSWGAIFAGVFVAIATMMALSLLGLGIGLASAPAAGSAAGLAKGLGVGGVVWLFISGILSFYAGGWVTGRMTRAGLVSESVVHSAVTWAFATTAFVFMLSSAVGGALAGAAGLAGSAGQAAGRGASAYASQSPQAARQLAGQIKGAANQAARRAQANLPSRPQAVQEAGTGAHFAGAAGIVGFILMVVEFLSCIAGGRAGTRILRPRPINARPRERETVA